MGRKSSAIKASQSNGVSGGVRRAEQAAERNRIFSLEAENEALKAEVDNLRNQLLEVKQELQQEKNHKLFLREKLTDQRQGVLMLQEEIAEKKNELIGVRYQLEQLKVEQTTSINKAKASVEKVHMVRIEAMKEEVNHLKECSLSPKVPQKPYNDLKTKETKRQRFQTVAKAIEQYVGPENLDVFLADFIQYIASNEAYSFATTLDAWDSFVASTRWKFSDGFLKDFKAFCKKKLKFDIFSSRQSISKIKKRFDPDADYYIVIERTKKKTRSGKDVVVPTAVITARDTANLLSRRLTTLHKNGRLRFDESTGDDIVVGFGGDKGADLTKIVGVLQNVDNPNNAHNCLLLGMYSGNDDHPTLKAKVAGVFDQINNLKTVTYLENGNPVTRKVVKRALGDCKFLSAVFNHAGQSSKFPCFACNASWSSHGSHAATLATFPFELSGPLRTLEQLLKEGSPLLKCNPEMAGPPQLHVFLGIVQSYVVNWLIALANREDYGPDVLPIDLKKQCKMLKTLEREEQCYESRAEGLRSAVGKAEKVMEVITKVAGNASVRRSEVHRCGSAFCVASISKKSAFGKISSFQCTTCNKNIHCVCGFAFTPDDEHKSAEGKYRCVDCRVGTMDINQRKDHLQELLDSLSAQLENDEDVLQDVISEREELDGMLKKSNGPTRKHLEEAFRSIGCDHRVWYQELTGNQVRKLLRSSSIDLILAVFPPSNEIDMMRKVMGNLEFLMSQADNKIKSDADIDRIEGVIDLLVSNLRDLQPDASVTPKLHLLAAHLVPYLRENRSWGRMTEQGLESLHAVINTLTSRFASVRDVRLHFVLILQQLSNYNLLHDTGISWHQSD
ncbi:unnamed protein product [Caenorhabditis sp. 36 PRJEB53466]|nr:unnamed protein product [Caenorhabditis sp. 36 PRJEB53466]